MGYNPESVLTSKRAYEVFREAVRSQEGVYAKELTKEIDIDQSLASEILSELEKSGLLEKGKRTRAQYYKINQSNFDEVFFTLWQSELDEDIKSALEEFEFNNKEFRKFLIHYALEYSKSNKESTIEEMLVSYFYEELDYQVQISGSSEYFSIFEELDSMSSKELPDWLKGLHALLKFFERRSNAGYVFDRALRGYSRDKKE